MKTIKSPLRYPGGKSKALKQILPLFPENVHAVVSPFVGGGSVEINLADKGIRVHAYDSFPSLICFWNYLNTDPEELASQVEKFFPITPEAFVQEKERHITLMNSMSLCDPSCADAGKELGTSFFVLNRSSFDGTILSGGCGKSPSEGKNGRFTLSAIARLRAWATNELLQFKFADFKDSLNEQKDDFVFADPPYLLKEKSNLYGDRGSHHKNFDHHGLFDILSKRDGWILCYNNCPEIRELYSKFKIIEPGWSYGMGKNKDGRGRELLILNY